MGFMKTVPYNSDKTLFRAIADFATVIPGDRRQSKYYGMIALGDYAIDDLPDFDGSSIDGIRVIFKKNKITEGLAFAKQVKDKGYELFINPTFVDQYTDSELLALAERVNHIHPRGFCIVDSMGVISPENLTRIFMLLDHNLLPDIKIGFHSHNNLQQSFMNAKALIDLRSKRDLVIDVSVMGMGRGAGNLNAELMISYLNQNCGAQYNLLPILKIADEHIAKIFAKTPWGYSIPYFLAASVKCHPNYASYLINKQTISIEAINAILLRIPEQKKASFDESLVKQLYLDYQQNAVDDSKVLKDLQTQIANRPILLVGPGKTLVSHHKDIDQFIAKEKPFIVSLNFRPDGLSVDRVFISNAKRFAEQKDFTRLVITSNIKADLPTLNYASYLNNSEMYDNSFLMFLRVLMKFGVRKVYAAGLDGFHANDNYAKPDMINNAKLGEFDKRNDIMRQMIEQFAQQIDIRFITPSLYAS
ncbi:MAG: 3-hydroxy-3-methylglutaryl-CoA lyase, partial [Alphaproteobacteria bacterium]|nr:3-hydroxy-3-methylglutaryl-CoA lyase [Alphaproteobacteria bacterium]